MAILISLIWLTALVRADRAKTPPMHCQGMCMPCCPAGASCAKSQCIEQAPESAEARLFPIQLLQIDPATTSFGARTDREGTSSEAFQTLRPGLRLSSSVFRLKDDLRI